MLLMNNASHTFQVSMNTVPFTNSSTAATAGTFFFPSLHEESSHAHEIIDLLSPSIDLSMYYDDDSMEWLLHDHDASLTEEKEKKMERREKTTTMLQKKRRISLNLYDDFFRSIQMEKAKARVENTSKELGIGNNPQLWTPKEVGLWCDWVSDQFKMPSRNYFEFGSLAIDGQLDDDSDHDSHLSIELATTDFGPNQTELNGSTFCNLSRDDFSERFPQMADYLYVELELWKNVCYLLASETPCLSSLSSDNTNPFRPTAVNQIPSSTTAYHGNHSIVSSSSTSYFSNHGDISSSTVHLDNHRRPNIPMSNANGSNHGNIHIMSNANGSNHGNIHMSNANGSNHGNIHMSNANGSNHGNIHMSNANGSNHGNIHMSNANGSNHGNIHMSNANGSNHGNIHMSTAYHGDWSALSEHQNNDGSFPKLTASESKDGNITTSTAHLGNHGNISTSTAHLRNHGNIPTTLSLPLIPTFVLESTACQTPTPPANDLPMPALMTSFTTSTDDSSCELSNSNPFYMDSNPGSLSCSPQSEFSPITMKTNGGRRSPDDVSRTGSHLWQFLQELLLRPSLFHHCIRWIDRGQGIFRIEDSVKVASLWGKRKNRPAMNYDKLSRSIRQYYKKGIIKKTEQSKRLVYQFCPEYLNQTQK